MAPAAGQLAPPAQRVVAITIIAVALWAVQVIDNGIVSVLMMGLLILAGVEPALVFSGFASTQFWVLVCVLFYGFAMQSTGLAARLSLYVLASFPGTYRGVLTAFLVIGIVLALGVPSMTVRTAIMVPIAWAMTEALELGARSVGTALIVLTSIEMAVLPGCAFLTGSLYGPVVESLFRSAGLELSWLGYAQVMMFPALMLSALIVIVNPFILRPQTALDVPREFATRRLAVLGPITRGELITAVIVVVSTAYWATGQLHRLPNVLIGLFALVIFAVTGIVRQKDLGTGVSWSLLLFLGGVFGLVNAIDQLGVARWAAASLAPAVRPLAFDPLLATLAAAVAMFAIKFLDPSGFVALAVLFLPLAEVTRDRLPPMVLVAALLVASAPFWVSYQNIWVVIGEGVTANQAFTGRQRIRLAHAYAALVLVTLAASVVFWRAVGLLHR